MTDIRNLSSLQETGAISDTRHEGISKASTAFIMGLALLAPFSISIYLPQLGLMPAMLHTTKPLAQLSYTVFFIGWASGQLIYGPLSDGLGRRRTLMVGLSVYILGTALCAIAPNIALFLGGRVIEGFGVCAATVLARAIAKDLSRDDQIAGVLSLISIGTSAGPAIAPTLGSLLFSLSGWRGIFIALATVGTILLITTTVFIKESWTGTGDTSISSHCRSIVNVCRDKSLVYFVFVCSAIQSAWFIYVVVAPFIYFRTLGLKTIDFSYISFGTASGVALGGWLSIRLGKRLSSQSLLRSGLAAAGLAGISLIILHFVGTRLIFILVPMMLYTLGLGMIIPNATALALAKHKERAGAASALLGFSMMSFSALATALVSTLRISTTLGLGISLVVAVLIACLASIKGNSV